MQFKIKCSCGKSFRADETMIGRKFTCPNCQQKLEVSAPQESSPAVRSENPSAPEQVINVQCACGKKYRVSGKHVGKRLKCAACGESITCSIPQPAPAAPSMPAESMFDPVTNTEVEQAPPKPTVPKTAVPQQKKKKSSAIAVLVAACTLGGLGAIAALVYFSGVLGPRATPSKLPGGVVATDAAQAATPPVPMNEWAFVPLQYYSDKYAFMDPRAKLNADGSGLHASVDAPINNVELVYRPCLEGDFKMQIEMQVHSMGKLNFPTSSPTFQDAQMVVGFLDAKTLRTEAMRVFLQPDQYSKKLSLTIERIGDQLSHNHGGPGATAAIPPTAKTGYVYILMCVPAMITIEKVDCVGTKKGIGFEVPTLTPLALDDGSWTMLPPSLGINPPKLSAVLGENITVGPNQSGSMQFNLPVRGDVYLRGKLKVNGPISNLPAGRGPSILQFTESSVSLVFESKTSGFRPPLRIAVGRNDTSFMLVRANQRIALYCDGEYTNASVDESGTLDTFSFEFVSSNHSVELSELQIFQSQ